MREKSCSRYYQGISLSPLHSSGQFPSFKLISWATFTRESTNSSYFFIKMILLRALVNNFSINSIFSQDSSQMR